MTKSRGMVSHHSRLEDEHGKILTTFLSHPASKIPRHSYSQQSGSFKVVLVSDECCFFIDMMLNHFKLLFFIGQTWPILAS